MRDRKYFIKKIWQKQWGLNFATTTKKTYFSFKLKNAKFGVLRRKIFLW
jgi:hypothetical protein